MATSDADRRADLAALRKVRDRIDRDYAKPLDVDALAREAHVSAGHLSRAFKAADGESPYSYLMTRRIERAMTLLRRGDLSVTDVCFAVGSARWAPSPHASLSWSVCRPAPTEPSVPTRFEVCRPASPHASPVRNQEAGALGLA